MVRNYVRKTQRASGYTEEQLENALNDIRNGNITLHRASQTYGIPKTTLFNRLTGKRGVKSQSLGRPLALGRDIEEQLAVGLKTLERWGFGLSRSEILHMIAEYVTQNNSKTPFKNNIPGEDWFLQFKKRYNLSIKKPQGIEYARKKMTDPFVINEYFTLLKKTLDDLDLHDKPNHIWNMDETSLCMDPSKTKVVGEKGKPSTRVISGPGRENTTILSTVNAAGEKAPPLVIYKGKFVWDQWVAGPHAHGDVPEGKIVYAASTKGWMEKEIFNNYFEKSFLPIIGEERPVLVIYDGHSTHVDWKVLQLAKENNITILKLPPHTSHLLQPLDLSVFKSLKTAWDKKLVVWQRINQGKKMPKKIFSELLREVWLETKPEIIQNGFKKAGISPFNPEVIPNATYLPSAFKRFENRNNNNLANEESGEEASLKTISTETSENEIIEQENLNPKVSIESLILEKIKQTTPSQPLKRRRVAAGAEIITSEEVISRLKEPCAGPFKAKPKNKRKPKDIISSSEDEDDPPAIESNSDLDLDEFEPEENCPNMEITDNPKVDIGQWVLVKYAGKKTIKHYVGKVQEKTNDFDAPWTVTFLKHSGKSKFSFPSMADTDNISEESVVLVLPKPTVDRRGTIFSFGMEFTGFNVY